MHLKPTMEKPMAKKRYGYRIKCCVPCCQAKRQDHLTRTYFKFPNPQQKVLHKIWVQKCHVNEEKLKKKNIYVCQIHFEKTKIVYNKLKKGTIPTLYLDSLADFRSTTPNIRPFNLTEPLMQQRFNIPSIFDITPTEYSKLFLDNYFKHDVDNVFEISLNPKDFLTDPDFNPTIHNSGSLVKAEEDDSDVDLMLKELQNARLTVCNVVPEIAKATQCSEACQRQKQTYEAEILKLKNELSKKDMEINELKRNNNIKQTALRRAITILEEASSSKKTNRIL